MKNVLLIGLVVLLIVFFGTFPLSILSEIFKFIGECLTWLAKTLNFFGWNGIMK